MKSILYIHWKDWCWSWSSNIWPPDAKSWLTRKDSEAGKDWRQEEKGMVEDEIVGWHHWLNGHEFEQAPGDGEGQRGLACCRPWCHKEVDRTEWPNNNNRQENQKQKGCSKILRTKVLILIYSMKCHSIHWNIVVKNKYLELLALYHLENHSNFYYFTYSLSLYSFCYICSLGQASQISSNTAEKRVSKE